MTKKPAERKLDEKHRKEAIPLRVLTRRNQYLRDREEWDKRIKERALLIERDQEYFSIPRRHGPRRSSSRRLVYVYVDESYVHRFHSRGFSWFHPDDDECATVTTSGKGERMVLLTGITEEEGMLNGLQTLLTFKAKQRTGDYHKNMDNDRFCEWLEDQLFPALRELGFEAIIVMDNASYHLNPAPGSIVPSSWTNKAAAYSFLDAHDIKHRKGRAPHGDNLDELKEIAHTWLKKNAKEKGIVYNISGVGALCRPLGHHILLTPQYHPELQPIEELWRDVKMYVGRKFSKHRSWAQLEEDVREGFAKYGTAEYSRRKVQRARQYEGLYKTHGVYGDAPDLTTITPTIDKEFVDLPFP